MIILIVSSPCASLKSQLSKYSPQPVNIFWPTVLITVLVFVSSSRNCMDVYPTFLAVMWCAGVCLSQGNHWSVSLKDSKTAIQDMFLLCRFGFCVDYLDITGRKPDEHYRFQVLIDLAHSFRLSSSHRRSLQGHIQKTISSCVISS